MTKRKDPEKFLKNGRPSKYKKELDDVAYGYALLGATDQMMADLLHIAKSTFNNWKKRYPRFMDSITRGKAPVDVRVAKSLLERACGYSHTEEKIFQHKGEIIRVQTIKHYPPDTSAASLWLRNRQPKIWRDRHDIALVDVDEDDFIPTKDLIKRQIELGEQIRILEKQL